MKIIPKVDRLPCRHPKRFVTQAGKAMCETCAELAAGWQECKSCRIMFPPVADPSRSHDRSRDERPVRGLCDECVASLDARACPECDGYGSYDCEDTDCHGQWCDLGFIECRPCGGKGWLPVVAVAS